MEDETKVRLLDEEVKVGDVLQVCRGAYGTGIVTRIYVQKDAYTGKPENWYVVERVHCSTSLPTGDSLPRAPGQFRAGQIQIGVERLDLPEKAVREMRAFITGPKERRIDNRATTWRC